MTGPADDPGSGAAAGPRWRALAVPYTLLRLAGQGAEFVAFVILARRLGPTASGVLAIAFLVCRYGGIIADWGGITRGARDVASLGRHGSVRAFVRRRSLSTAVVSAVAAAGFLATGYAELLPVVVVVLNLGLTRDWLALGREQGTRAAVPGVVQGTTLAAAALLASTSADGARAIALGYGAAVVVSLVLNRLPDEPAGEKAPGPDAWILFAYIAIQVTSSFDTMLLGALRSTADAGIYAAIYRIPNAWIAVLTALVGGAMPMATRAQTGSTADYLRLRTRSLRAGAVAGGALLLTAPVAYVLVPLLFGVDYAAGQRPAVLLIVATAIITASAPLHVFAVATGHDRRYATIVGVSAATNVGLNLAMIPAWGMEGAALATLVAQSLTGVLLWRATDPRRNDPAASDASPPA